AASGIGAATARKLMADGWRVACLDRDVAGARATAGEKGRAMEMAVGAEGASTEPLAGMAPPGGGPVPPAPPPGGMGTPPGRAARGLRGAKGREAMAGGRRGGCLGRGGGGARATGGGKGLAIEIDVADEGASIDAFAEIAAAWGGLDALVTAAGVIETTPF